MPGPSYGFIFNKLSSGLQAAVTTDMATLFMCGSSEDATPSFLPVNETRMYNSSDPLFLANLGTGALKWSVQLVNAQLGLFGKAARIVVNRIAKGASDEETIANIIGDQGAGTGIYASLKAGMKHQVIPRLFLFPDGLTGKFTRAASSKVVTRAAKFGGNTGTGLLTLAAPAFGASVKAGVYRVRCKTAAAGGGAFSVVDPDGQVLADATAGAAYTGEAVRFTIAAGTGTGAKDFIVGDGFDVTVTVTAGAVSANPICAALPQVCNALFAHAIVDGPGTTKEDDLDWRETLASGTLIPVSTYVAPVGAADGFFVGMASVVAGAAVYIDSQTKGGQGVPSRSFANYQVQGITALKRYDTFSLLDGANDGQELLAAGIGVIQRGETGVESAASDTGFNMICYMTADTDSEYQFINVSRVRNYTFIQLIKYWRNRIGKNNITVSAVQAVENDGVRFLGGLKGDEHIIDFRFGLDPTKNLAENIRAGKLRLFFKSEESSPLLLITTDSYRYPEALDALVQALANETNTVLTDAA